MSRHLPAFVGVIVAALLLDTCSALPDKGDEIVSQLSLGLSREDVVARLGEAEHSIFTLPWGYLYFSAGTEAVPSNLLLTLREGTEEWRYGYWVSSNNKEAVRVFFSEKGTVIGWTHVASRASREKYHHELLTRQLSLDMSEEEVRRLLGEPLEFVPSPTRLTESRQLYADHYWNVQPTDIGLPNMWVYRYTTAQGSVRRVYIKWRKAGVWGWGYDHAGEEARRHLDHMTCCPTEP